MNAVTDAASSTTDRLYERNMEMEKGAERREKQGKTEGDMTAAEIEQTRNHGIFAKKVGEITKDAERALRELIDFDDEQKMHAHHIGVVHEAIADAAPSRNRNRGDEEEYEDDVEIISAAELYKKTKADYATGYASKSMMDRYVYSFFATFHSLGRKSNQFLDMETITNIRTSSESSMMP